MINRKLKEKLERTELKLEFQKGSSIRWRDAAKSHYHENLVLRENKRILEEQNKDLNCQVSKLKHELNHLYGNHANKEDENTDLRTLVVAQARVIDGLMNR